MARWTYSAAILAVGFFGLSLSSDVYELTSPSGWPWHVLLRKLYSIVAFTIVGYAARRAFLEHDVAVRMPAITAFVAAYSALIEVAQFVHGSHEGLRWNAVDVACGALGGLVASVIPTPRAAEPNDERHVR